MRSLMVIIDGLGDDPIDAFGGRTPLNMPGILILISC